ncbi:hypothetical protein ELH72_27625 (plasmid) [Rhizobium ruizarguesonis]|nr:hypothetical protein ELH72_27625 [Rhizobium ruizarguesonis]
MNHCIAEIEYRAWAHDGNLRHASYKGLRERQDRPPFTRLTEDRRDLEHSPTRSRRAVFVNIEIGGRGRDSNPASQLEGWKQPRIPEGWGERRAPITLTPD